MKRHAHMVDLLRPEMSFTVSLERLAHKVELTVEDLDTIAKNAQGLMRAAEIVKAQRRLER